MYLDINLKIRKHQFFNHYAYIKFCLQHRKLFGNSKCMFKSDKANVGKLYSFLIQSYSQNDYFDTVATKWNTKEKESGTSMICTLTGCQKRCLFTYQLNKSNHCSVHLVCFQVSGSSKGTKKALTCIYNSLSLAKSSQNIYREANFLGWKDWLSS